MKKISALMLALICMVMVMSSQTYANYSKYGRGQIVGVEQVEKGLRLTLKRFDSGESIPIIVNEHTYIGYPTMNPSNPMSYLREGLLVDMLYTSQDSYLWAISMKVRSTMTKHCSGEITAIEQVENGLKLTFSHLDGGTMTLVVNESTYIGNYTMNPPKPMSFLEVGMIADTIYESGTTNFNAITINVLE